MIICSSWLLDPMLDNTDAGFDVDALGLTLDKPTILFAPTFNPSSLDRFPDN